MKRVLQYLILGPLALFWFLMLWVISPFTLFLIWLTARPDEPPLLRNYWEFSLEGFRSLAPREY